MPHSTVNHVLVLRSAGLKGMGWGGGGGALEELKWRKGDAIKAEWACQLVVAGVHICSPFAVGNLHVWIGVFFFFFEAWRSPAEKTHSLLTLRGSSKDGRYVHFPMFYIKP